LGVIKLTNMIKNIFIFFTLVTLLVACKKDKDDSNNNNTSNTNNFVRFKVNGVLVETIVWNASYGNIVGSFLTCNLTSNMHQNEKTININVNAITAGEYEFAAGAGTTPNKAYGLYYPKYTDYFNTYSFNSGKFTITQIDTVQKIFAGKFYGTVANDSGAELQITDGEFRAPNLTRF
jgi:hypothetical protein